MTDYADKLVELSRIPCSLAVLTLDLCALSYGLGSCAASGAAGEECYNTYPTCQDKTNFDRSTVDYRFTSHEAPLPFEDGERPYILNVDYLPTEIKDSLTVKGRVSVELADEPDTDVGIDPYVANRASVQGTFWKKLLARNTNYKGRPLKIYDGFIGLAEADFIAEGQRFTGVVDNIKMGKGKVTVEAIDLLKSLDGADIPPSYDLKLAAEITAVVTSATLSGDDVTSLDSPTGYVRIDDEIIYYGAIDTGTGIVSSCTRGMFGTTGAEHSDNVKVSAVKYYAAANPFEMMQTILDDAGIAAGDIDDTAFDAEQAFAADLDVEAIISESTPAGELYWELVDLLGCKSWINESLKITIARSLPNRPDRTYQELSDAENILADSAEVDLNQKSLITRCSLYWDWSVVGDLEEPTDFARLTMVLDADAEGENEQNAVSEKKVMSRWIRSGTATEEQLADWTKALAERAVWPHRTAMPIITFDVELRDSDILTGDHVQLTTDELQGVDGNDLAAAAFQVVKREKKANLITLECLRLTDTRLAYFAAADAPDYDAATAEEKNEIGFFCDSAGEIDGQAGYVFY